MAKFTWSEIFRSIEAEALYTGTPTIYVRFSRCNFTCKGFNNPTMLDDGDGYAPVTFNPKDYQNLQDMPIITMGCDSQYAVNDAFSHTWITGTEDDIVAELHKILPDNSFINSKTGLRHSLSLTGGEPSLFFKQIPALINHPGMSDCEHVIFETNCSVPIGQKTLDEISNWLKANPRRKWTWSNSPKLTDSGELSHKAIRPDVAYTQMLVDAANGQVEQYFKFVVNPTEEAFDEVDNVMEQYYAGGVDNNAMVYMMPAACISSQQDTIAAAVARMCMIRGRLYCHRVQMIFGNGVGT